jgi:hypothetical protein
MIATIAAWLKGVFSIADLFVQMQQFFHTAPQPLDYILGFTSWVFLLGIVAIPAIGTTALASHLGLNATDLTIRAFFEKLRNGVWDFVTFPAPRVARVYHLAVDNWPSPKLQAIGALGDAPTVQWEIRDSLVVATEATAQGVQHFLELCDMSKTSQLRLTATVSVSCEALSSQIDHPQSMATLRRQSKDLQQTVHGQLADEFADFARFLHLLRDSPAAAALNPHAPRSGFESFWKAVQYRLDVAYRSVWCRWIRRQPRSTLHDRKSRLVGLFDGSLNRRETWLTNFDNLSSIIKKKSNLSCPDSDGCGGIEAAARQLGPASMSSSLFIDLSVHVHGAEAGTWSKCRRECPRAQAQKSRPRWTERQGTRRL